MGPFETLTAKLTDDVLCHIGRFFPRVVLFVTLSGVLLVTSNLGDQGRSRMEEAWFLVSRIDVSQSFPHHFPPLLCTPRC